MWFTQPTYNSYIPYSYTPHGHGYPSPEDSLNRAIARDRAAREREAAARRRHGVPRWQDATRSSYSPYLSDDDDGGSFVPYPYDPRAYSYTPRVDEDLRLSQIQEHQRQLQLAHQAELNRRREAERTQEFVEQAYTPRVPEPTYTSAPRFPVPISSPKVSPSSPSDKKRTRHPKNPLPPSPQELTTSEATPEETRAAMTIQDFYRRRIARRQALASIDELSTQFEQVKSNFSSPPQLDFRDPALDNNINIAVSPESFTRASSIPEDAEDTGGASKPIPGLAYTANNRAVHGYIENLSRLLVKLDKVESGGDAQVREKRKQMIRNVDAEAQWMDRWIAAVWDVAQAQARPEPQRNRQLRPQPTMEDVFDKD